MRAQQRLRSAQADLSLRWTHIHFVGFVMRQLIYKTKYTSIYCALKLQVYIMNVITPGPLYNMVGYNNTVRYNTVLDITQIRTGPQMAFKTPFPI